LPDLLHSGRIPDAPCLPKKLRVLRALTGKRSQLVETRKRLIPTCTDQNSSAHWRHPMDMMRSGWPISLFQASQQ
jgi:hypothetical protein